MGLSVYVYINMFVMYHSFKTKIYIFRKKSMHIHSYKVNV